MRVEIEMHSMLKDPGTILLYVLVAVAAIVVVWWPTDIYFQGISLVGWLMFSTYFVWFVLAIVYVIWIEKVEKEKEAE